MQVFGLPGHVTRHGRYASRLVDAEPPNIEAERRRDAVVRWRGAMRAGLTAAEAAQAAGVPRATLYRWQKAPVPKSRRPHRMRQKHWSPALRAEVERLRLDFPMWGKEKLGPILRDQGFAVSNATVGRIIASLVAKGRVPRVGDPSARRRAKAMPSGPSPSPIATLLPKTPPTSSTKSPPKCHGPSRPSRSMAAPSSWPSSKTACAAKAIPLYVLPPRSPKLNGAVERCNGAWR